MKEEKRVFFALEIIAPWPKDLPSGRLLAEADRHLTLAFLGTVDYRLIKQKMQEIPPFPLRVGIVGQFTNCLLLPLRRPNVAAWDVYWLDDPSPLLSFRETLIAWLGAEGFPVALKEEEFLSHVTLCRWPFDKEKWMKSFTPLPLVCTAFHLYESLGKSVYKPIWSRPLLPAFQEIEHTADIAFQIRGESLFQLLQHAKVALAFRFPSFLSFNIPTYPTNLDDVISCLNEMITRSDKAIGVPFKAVSLHGEIHKEEDETFLWEMIVDV